MFSNCAGITWTGGIKFKWIEYFVLHLEWRTDCSPRMRTRCWSYDMSCRFVSDRNERRQVTGGRTCPNKEKARWIGRLSSTMKSPWKKKMLERDSIDLFLRTLSFRWRWTVSPVCPENNTAVGVVWRAQYCCCNKEFRTPYPVLSWCLCFPYCYCVCLWLIVFVARATNR